MEKSDSIALMRDAAAAKAQWGAAITKFNQEIERVQKRLIHEAVRNYMSAAQVATELGITTKRVHDLMRKSGLNPSEGKRLLAHKAAQALEKNAELMGIKPWQMDLTSPLAYLPMGKAMEEELLEARIHRVTEIEDDYPVDDEFLETLIEAFQEAWHNRDDEWRREGGTSGEPNRTKAGIKAVLGVLNS